MAASRCSLLRSAALSPPITAFGMCRCMLRGRHPFRCGGHSIFASLYKPDNSLSGWVCYGYSGSSVRFYSVPNLMKVVMEELAQLRSGKKVRAGGKIGVFSDKEFVQDKLEKQVLEKGVLLEFRKDTERVLLAVAQKPDGKKNWMVCDQNGVMSSIKPQQVTYIVPGVEDFDHKLIADFVERAQNLMDPSILEYAWAELLENKKRVTAQELAKIIYGYAEPLGSYCAHLLLSKDEIYFAMVEINGSVFVYEPRSTAQVEELLKRKHAKEVSKKEHEEFVQLLVSAKALDPYSKPPKSSWILEDKIRCRVKDIEAYAIDACTKEEEKKMVGMILRSMGLSKTPSAAMKLLIDIGYFPVHVNLDLLKLNVCNEFSSEALLESENLLCATSDPDEMNRKDLTFLKVYAIDVDEADELDDALSATRLHDGRIKVWIHIADPACLVQPNGIIDREAMIRGTSIFLPTATYPMFPQRLAMERMSLQQGKLCKAVSVSVILNPDGSIADHTIDNSVIRPTYMLTYDSASELLDLNLEEEPELRILSEAAFIRFQWRLKQGAVDTSTIKARIKVPNPDDPEPDINLYVENQAAPAMRLVTEMMLLCGEAVASFGSYNNIPLPYRGQPQSNVLISSFSHLPEGPVRSHAYVKMLRAAKMDFKTPIHHSVLGLPGYVQFTSPIRRYQDMLAHYQVKAFLRGEILPFSARKLEGLISLVNMHSRLVRRLCNSSLRYWLLEYLRRQPRGKKFRAIILRFIKDRMAELLLLEVGIQSSASVMIGKQVGDEIDVKVEESHPRDDLLILKSV